MTKLVSVRMYVQKQKSLQIFHRKNHGLLAWLLNKCIYISVLLIRLPALLLLATLKRSEAKRQKVKATVAALRFHLFGIDPT